MRIVGPGGKWECPCTMVDVSDNGARLRLGVPVTGLDLSSFTLKLSKFGESERQCELVWHDGDYIGVRFLEKAPGLVSATATHPAA